MKIVVESRDLNNFISLLESRSKWDPITLNICMQDESCLFCNKVSKYKSNNATSNHTRPLPNAEGNGFANIVYAHSISIVRNFNPLTVKLDFVLARQKAC